METFSFGKLTDGREIKAWRLKSPGGAEAVILDYGCTVQSLRVPDRNGSLRDVVLGYDTAEEYEKNDGFFGAAIGRVGNRIGGSSFRLDGKDYQLESNEGRNQLHGGPKGFNCFIWQGKTEGEKLIFSRRSPEGEGGFPGNLDVRIIYELLEGNTLSVTYDAETDAPTPVNLTNHSYFNLSGHGNILDHELQLFAGAFTEIDDELIPTGRIIPVEGTPMDFRTVKKVGRDISADYRQLQLAGGYDHNFVLSGSEGGMQRAAVVRSPESGIILTVETTEPGVQFYTGNSITARKGKGGSELGAHSALCLETQKFPDAVHHGNFPDTVIRPGKPYHACTRYSFRTDRD
ncbi:MAG: aldose epimerase family protein [Candidatus Limivicinus sp.]